MAFSKGRVDSMTLDQLLEIVSEAKLLGHYFGITNIPCVIKSPLRKDDHPSFSLTSYDGERIFYRDFKTGKTGNTFTLLKEYWCLNTIQEVINRICKELLVTDGSVEAHIYKLGKSYVTINEAKISKSIIELKCKVRQWKEWDIQFWSKYGISLEWLKFSNTYPISHIIITKDGTTSTIPADKYAYVYVEFKDGIESLKIYQPYSLTHKWSNNHDVSVWDLWQQLPETGDDLIITSSRKDALCIWANTGVPSISLQAESYLPKSQVIEELKRRFKRVWILYDNDWEKKDNPGRILGAKLAKEFDLAQIEIPQVYLSKDSSDLYKNHSFKILREVIFKLINKKTF